MKKLAACLSIFLLTTPILASAADSLVTEAPADAKAYFIEPQDGAVIEGPVKVVFGLENMGVAPAGVERENTGHHHLLIDEDTLPDMTQPLPADDHVKHFGGGQTETVLNLAPGKHTLQLVVGNYVHVPNKTPVISKKITITVK